jgi:hypothetical protein
MTCRTACAGEQLPQRRGRDAGGDRVSRARRGSVAASPESTRISGSTRHRFDCRNRGLELVVPALAKSLSGQRHIDVRFYALAFDDGADIADTSAQPHNGTDRHGSREGNRRLA